MEKVLFCRHKLDNGYILRLSWLHIWAQTSLTFCDPMDTRLLWPWDFLGKSTGVGCHFLLQQWEQGRFNLTQTFRVPLRNRGLPRWLNPPANAGDKRDSSSTHGLRRLPGEGNGHPLQYSCLENSMGRGAWQAAVHGVAKSWTRLSYYHTLKNRRIADLQI